MATSVETSAARDDAAEPPARVVFPFRLSRRGAWLAIAALAAAAVAFLAGTWLAWNLQVLPRWTPYEVRFLVDQSNLADENLIAAWFSALLFLAVAPAALACFGTDLLAARSPGERFRALGWLGIGAMSVLLSIDEIGALHEPSSLVVNNPFSSTLHGWVGVLAIPILLVGAFLLWFAWRSLREHPPAFWLLVFGVLLYLSVPVQEQLEAGMRVQVEPY